MHGDHVGGLVVGGKIAFPRATVYAHQREADYWLDSGHLAAAREWKAACAEILRRIH